MDGNGNGTQVKVCGITEPAEIDVLAGQGVDLVGLWYGVPDGPADLPLSDWRELGAAAAATDHLAPVLVTFLKDVDALREALEGSGVSWVQLHGYQMPGVVRAVKEISPDIRVLKVLHVRGDDCVEAPLIGSYEKAGVDVFLFDAVAEDGRVGSTGETLDPAVVASLAERISARSCSPAGSRTTTGATTRSSRGIRISSGSTWTRTRAERTAR